MVNWKLRETIDITILVIVAVSLFFPEGIAIIPALSEKVANLFVWNQVLAVALAWVVYSYKQIVRV